MKKAVLILIACLLLLASNVFADDVSIDQDGNITTGLSNSGNLEVIGSSGEGSDLLAIAFSNPMQFR